MESILICHDCRSRQMTWHNWRHAYFCRVCGRFADTAVTSYETDVEYDDRLDMSDKTINMMGGAV